MPVITIETEDPKLAQQLEISCKGFVGSKGNVALHSLGLQTKLGVS